MHNFIIENGILTKYEGYERNIEVPEDVTAIGESAFYSCLTVTKVKIGENVTEIEFEAYLGETKMFKVMEK